MNEYTNFGDTSHITVHNENISAFRPKNLVTINWPSFGERDIAFAEQFAKDLSRAIRAAKKATA